MTPDERSLRADPHPEAWGVLADYLEDRGDPEAAEWRSLAAFAASALPLLRRITHAPRRTLWLLPCDERFGLRRVVNNVDFVRARPHPTGDPWTTTLARLPAKALYCLAPPGLFDATHQPTAEEWGWLSGRLKHLHSLAGKGQAAAINAGPLVAPSCPSCGESAELYRSGDFFGREGQPWSENRLWACRPCDARVGCRAGTNEPLGTLAGPSLRAARRRAHDAFDPLWRSGALSRSGAYAWLAARLGITTDACHVALFDEATCDLAAAACLAAMPADAPPRWSTLTAT